MQMFTPRDTNAESRRAIADMDRRDGYPIAHSAFAGGATFMECGPGIYQVRVVKQSKLPPLVLTGGMHGDEKSGIVILDGLINAIKKGELPVKRNLLLAFGNLRAMAANDFLGARCVEMEAGATSNLNRCFGRGIFENPRCYAEHRANQLMEAVDRFVAKNGIPEAIDIHQSFDVPTLQDVRGVTNRTEYTYAMAYPVGGDLEGTLRWFHRSFSDIVAGVVVNDMAQKHHTFAGYMANTFGAHAATFEQGTIGYEDINTFTPQLQENLARKIGGETALATPLGFDVWRCVRSVTKQSEAFRFFDIGGEVAVRAPRDFVEQHARVFARDGDTEHALTVGQRLLFAKIDVPIGDRAAAIIERLETDLVPRP